MRRFLTEEFVSKAQPPEKGERWIADTGVRGFGLRLWAPNGKAFAIRTKDKDDKSVRRTFDPHSQSSYWNLYRWRRLNQVSSVSDLDLSSFLELAREWAREELDEQRKINTFQTSFEETELEHAAMRRRVGNYLRSKQLGELVEQVLCSGHARGWSQEYTDRLRAAFNAFDPDDKIRQLRIFEFEDGRLTRLVENAALRVGSFRLLRSLLSTVFWNIHELGGGLIGYLFPNHSNLSSKHIADYQEILSSLEFEDFLKLENEIENIDFDWRSKLAITLCFSLRAPVSKILSGRWTQIVEDRWYPYHPKERASWHWRWDSIGQKQLSILKSAKEKALSEGVSSDYWFPSKSNGNHHIRNVDRAWKKICVAANWPNISLAKTVEYKKTYFPTFGTSLDYFDSGRMDEAKRERQRIASELALLRRA